MNERIEFLTNEILKIRQHIGNNMKEQAFFMTQENDFMIDKIDSAIKNLNAELRVLESKLKEAYHERISD